MIFYYLIVVLRKLVRLFRIPNPHELARADINARCPVCGWRKGWIRCVLKAKPMPTSREVLPEGFILCQHSCKVCGARWHDMPILKVDPSKVMPSVARNELETKEDRQPYMQTEETVASA